MDDFPQKPTPTRLFLSYSRDDDEPFVRRLYEDLITAGFDVWFDRVSMPSRQLTFYQEIRDAIAERDRLVLIVGSKAVVSAYVDQEWRFALEAGKCVNPIVRLPLVLQGGYADAASAKDAQQKAYELVPEELKLIHTEDFRDDTHYTEHLANLIRQLADPAPPLGKLIAVPGLPVHYRAQPDRLYKLREALLIDLQTPVVVTGAAAKVGVEGMAGIGKSVLAAALARDPEVRRAFPDGVLWVGVGQLPQEENAQQQRLAELQRNVARELGNEALFNNPQVGKQVLRDLLADGKKAVLILLDDVWQRAAADAFDVVGPRSRLLLTTRDAGLVTALTGTGYQVQLPSEGEALALLASNAGLTVTELPEQSRQVIGECGRLPLALALCGGMLRSGTPWRDLLDALREHDLEYLKDDYAAEEQHQNIARALELSIHVLPEDKQRRFAELAVFAEDAEVPEAAVLTLWGHTAGLSERNGRQLLLEFKQRSVAQYQTTDGSATISLHDLMHHLATRMAVHLFGSLAVLHQQLLDAYRKKSPDGWHTGQDDGYFFQNICKHLAAAAGNWDEVVELLCDLRFVEARCKIGQVFELIADYRLAKENLPEAQEELRKEQAQQERLQRWTREITEYSQQWSERRDQLVKGEKVDETEPQLPEPPETCRMWTEDEIEVECQRIIENATRIDRLDAFRDFVKQECYPLIEFGKRPGFVMQQAFSYAPIGPVHDSGKTPLPALSTPYILRRWSADARYNPKPTCLRTLEGHSECVYSVSITPDGRRVVSGSEDKTLRVWDLESGACLRILEGHSECVYSANITPDGRRVVSGSWDKTLKFWDLESGACLRTLEGHNDGVYSVSITPEGQRVVSGGGSGTIRVWDLESGTCFRTFEGHSECVYSVNITPDGRRVVSGSWDKTLRVWDLESGASLRTLEGHRGGVFSVSITPDGRRVVSGSLDETLKVWDLESGACLRTLEGHSDGVYSVSITPDGRRVVSGSGNGTVRVWDMERGTCLRVLESSGLEVRGASVTADGRLAVSGSWDKTLRVWNLLSGAVPKMPEKHNNSVSNVIITPDGRRALTMGESDKTLKVWDMESGKCLSTLKDGGNGFNSMSIMPNGQQVLLGNDDKIREWDIEARKWLRALENSRSVVCTCITPDGRQVVSGGDKLRVWDLESGICLRTLVKYNIQDIFDRVIVTPNGRQVVWATHGTVGLWDLESGVCLWTLQGHSERVDSVSITPDRQRLVSGSQDGTLQVWDMESGVCLQTLKGHSGEVHSVCITPDGRLAVSAGSWFRTDWNTTLRVWDIDSRTCLQVFRTVDRINAIGVFSQKLAIGLETGEVLFVEMYNFGTGPAILTALNSQRARCPMCGHEFKPQAAIIAAIQGSDVTDLFSNCPDCKQTLKFNPFFSTEDDYIEVLLRGLEQLRLKKSGYLEDTIAHLSAIVIHFEKICKYEDAKAYAVERDQLRLHYDKTLISRLKEESKGRILILKLLNEQLAHGNAHPKIAICIYNLCIELIKQGRLEEVKPLLDNAWRLKAGQHDLVSGHILFVELSVAFLETKETGIYMGKLKTLLAEGSLPDYGEETGTWDISSFIEYLRTNLPPDTFEFLTTLAEILNDITLIKKLNEYELWKEAVAVSLE